MLNMNGFYFHFVQGQTAGNAETFGSCDFEMFKLTILRDFFWKAAAEPMVTEASNATIISVKGELGLQFGFFKRNRNKRKT